MDLEWLHTAHGAVTALMTAAVTVALVVSLDTNEDANFLRMQVAASGLFLLTLGQYVCRPPLLREAEEPPVCAAETDMEA